jgi:hypothetical protein
MFDDFVDPRGAAARVVAIMKVFLSRAAGAAEVHGGRARPP